MTDGSTAQPLAQALSALATLSTAQHVLLNRISSHDEPVTVAELSAESGLQPSSIRETLDALHRAGLVERRPLPSQGRGRPALGYMSLTPTDPTFPAQMLNQLASSVIEWLHVGSKDPHSAVLEIGRAWGDNALKAMRVPDHSASTPVPEGFTLATHMGKIRTFLTAMGFAAKSLRDEPLAFVLTACPFTDHDDPDPLALELRRGIIERILERTATGMATWVYVQDPARPLRATVTLDALPSTDRRPLMSTLRFFGGAAEAAGADSLDVEASTMPGTLGELLDRLADEHPALGPVLDVSSFLVDERPAAREATLRPGMRIDVLPPFAGG